MKTVIRTTLSVGLNTIVIREWEAEQIFENERNYMFAIYLNDVVVDSYNCFPSFRDNARNDLLAKWSNILNNVSK